MAKQSYQVVYHYTYFKHLPRCIVQARFRFEAVSAKAAIAKALRHEAPPKGLIEIIAKQGEANA